MPDHSASRVPESPTISPLLERGLGPVLARNIAAMQARNRRDQDDASLQHKAADGVTRFAGSMAFVYVHLAAVGFWVAANLGWLPHVPRFDPQLMDLATTASVEAIFLSTFVLISQNRAAEAADRRSDLDLQINLLTEHEVTRLIALTRAVADKLGVSEAADEDLHELARDVAPETVLEGMDEAKRRDKETPTPA